MAGDLMECLEVALLAEGVDRNYALPRRERAFIVALLAEGVDRNMTAYRQTVPGLGSPSSRRAWIEISRCPSLTTCPASPSSRRAWIEINRSMASLMAAQRSPSSRRAWIEI